MDIKIITDVATEPVTTEQAKTHMRISGSDDDTYIDTLITIAREWTEQFTGRALATQTLEIILDKFPSKDFIEMPMSPVQSITSIKYKNSDGDETTWDSSNYIVNNDILPCKIYLAYGEVYPDFTEYPTGAVRIRSVHGHKSDEIALPKAIYHALLLLISHLYENREATIEKALNETPFAVKSLLVPYRLRWW